MRSDDEIVTTAVSIPHWVHKLLRAVAYRRSVTAGGRASVSKVVVELVERHRKELEKEAGPYLD